MLFPAACKSTWYGRWGYGFGRAGFGIKPAAWKRAVSAVSGFCIRVLRLVLSGTVARACSPIRHGVQMKQEQRLCT